MIPPTFRCYWVDRDSEGRLQGQVAWQPLDELPDGEVLVRVAFSSLNYKDALSASGHPGVTPRFPHIPGIDAAGWVVGGKVADLQPSQPVLVTGPEQGVSRPGGFAEYVRVPRGWIIPLPEGLSFRESMALGTAGFTAALCVRALEQHGIVPQQGDIAVTGASGGVGSVAVALLAKLGYRVVAITGKPAAHDFLRRLGAAEIAGREVLDNPAGRPLLSGRWAGAVDTVGGPSLAGLLAAMRPRGCVAACGMVAGVQLETTVYPFILRGVTLAGIDAVSCPRPLREQIWSWLAGVGKPDHLDEIGHVVDLEELPEKIAEILAGQTIGRTVVRLAKECT